MKRKMHAGAWLTVIALGCVAIFAVAVLIYGLSTGFGLADLFRSTAGSTYDTPYTYTEEATTLREIEVDWTSGPVKLEFYSGDTIQITETAKRELKEDEKLLLELSGGKLSIHWNSAWLDFNIMPDDSKQLEIRIPEQFADTLESVDIDTASSDIVMQDLTAAEIRFETVSGDIEISNITAENLKLDTTSGTVTGSGLTGTKSLRVGCVSGDMALTGMEAGILELDSTSGRIEAEGKAEEAAFDSVSGEIIAALRNQPEKLTAESVSGSMEITLPESQTGFLCKFSSVSGNFDCGFDTQKSGDLYLYGEGNSEVKLSTTSGDVLLNPAG